MPKKNLVWEDITAAVNTVGVALRTTQEINDKWKNLQSTAKKEFSGFRKEQKTGRGPAPPNLSEATLKIIEMFSETLSFTGLRGFETSRFAGGNIYFCGYLKCNERHILYRLIFHPCCVKNFAARRQGKKNIFVKLYV